MCSSVLALDRVLQRGLCSPPRKGCGRVLVVVTAPEVHVNTFWFWFWCPAVLWSARSVDGVLVSRRGMGTLKQICRGRACMAA